MTLKACLCTCGRKLFSRKLLFHEKRIPIPSHWNLFFKKSLKNLNHFFTFMHGKAVAPNMNFIAPNLKNRLYKRTLTRRRLLQHVSLRDSLFKGDENTFTNHLILNRFQSLPPQSAQRFVTRFGLV